MEPLIQVKDLCKVYNPGENAVHAVDHVDLTVEKGRSLWPSSVSQDPENQR